MKKEKKKLKKLKNKNSSKLLKHNFKVKPLNLYVSLHSEELSDSIEGDASSELKYNGYQRQRVTLSAPELTDEEHITMHNTNEVVFPSCPQVYSEPIKGVAIWTAPEGGNLIWYSKPPVNQRLTHNAAAIILVGGLVISEFGLEETD
jgi:hypothetical protein